MYKKVFKRCFDLFLSLVGILVLSPFFLLTSLFIFVTDPGPVFFTQKRIGKGKRIFHILKFRTYLSYLPKEKVAVPLRMNKDARGSFTEILKTRSCGQFSVNVSAPGMTKGQHWHHSKWEIFVVVSGHGRIEERKIGTNEVLRFDVDGESMTAVYMLPGYTHNIINLSDTEPLVTLMWANEPFDPNKPETYREPV